MANSLQIRLRGNDIDRVFQRVGINKFAAARLMGKGHAESAKFVKSKLGPILPRGKTRYTTRGGKRTKILAGQLRQSVKARRVASNIDGVKVAGSGAVVGYGNRKSFYAWFIEYGTQSRTQKKTGRKTGRIRAGRYLQKLIRKLRGVMESILLRETRKEFVKQVRLAKGGRKSLDRTLARLF